jgi:hypothetical protein
MTDDKVYTPAVIDDLPLPGQVQEGQSQSEPKSGEVFRATNTKDTPLPRKVIAQETISSSLNTKSKKILGDFELADSGAISIGKYTNGVSGDVRLTPNGITARDISGNTTFAIDGDTGNAVFQGTIQAGDVTVMDEGGLVSLANFSSSDKKLASLIQSISTAEPNWTDITGSDMTITLTRRTLVLLMAKITFYTGVVGGAGTIDHLIRISVDNDSSASSRIFCRNPSGAFTSSMHRLEILEPGEHPVKLQGTVNRDTGSPEMVIYNYYFTYLTLGS